MIREIERILKKHLHSGEADALNCEQDIYTTLSPYEYVWSHKTYAERMTLARELFTAIGRQDISKLIKIPNQADTVAIMERILPIEDKDYAKYAAKNLRRWLVSYGQGDINRQIDSHLLRRGII